MIFEHDENLIGVSNTSPSFFSFPPPAFARPPKVYNAVTGETTVPSEDGPEKRKVIESDLRFSLFRNILGYIFGISCCVIVCWAKWLEGVITIIIETLDRRRLIMFFKGFYFYEASLRARVTTHPGLGVPGRFCLRPLGHRGQKTLKYEN